MATVSVPCQWQIGESVDVEIVCGDLNEGIGNVAANSWNRGYAVELWRGEAVEKQEHSTWDCPSGGCWEVVRNGDDMEWSER